MGPAGQAVGNSVVAGASKTLAILGVSHCYNTLLKFVDGGDAKIFLL
jgi:hypothetical protein